METEHVPIERLREIVTHEDVMFTQEELNHIRVCTDCFNKWEELITEERAERAARNS